MGKRHHNRIELGSNAYDVPVVFRASAPLPEDTLSNLERQLLWFGARKRSGFVREVHNTFMRNAVWYQEQSTLEAVADFELFHGLVEESTSLRTHPSYVFDVYVRERWPTSNIDQRIKQKLFLGITSELTRDKTFTDYLAPLDSKHDRVERYGREILMWYADWARSVDLSWLHNPDPAICAYYDFVQRAHLLPMDDFLAGLSKLYGRDICFQEVAWGEEGLRATADIALYCYKNGIPGPIENPGGRKMDLTDLKIWLLEKGAKIIEVDFSQFRQDDGIDRSGYDGWMP